MSFRNSATVLSCFYFLATHLVAGDSPNILIITADNLGYGDLPCYNPDSKIVAPHLDQLASESALLTDFYTASSTCTVSRACLLTGRIAQRHGLDYQLPGVDGNYGIGLDHQEILIPSVLKSAPTPYATACLGKWNIGFAEGSRPTERGFDEFVGNASGNCDYFYHNYREMHDLYNGTEELYREGDYITDIYADAAIDFMRRKSEDENPWFCYLPFNAPHFPTAGNKRPGQPNNWQAPDWAFDSYEFGPDEDDPIKRYYAVVTALDSALGRVLDALEETGEADNTFVFFMSDNGAFRLDRKGLDVGINTPLRSGGVTCWEGGIRVAAMARWPGEIAPGTTISEPLWSPDLMIACAELAGARRPEGVVLDGKNPLPVLTSGAVSPHETLYFEYSRHAALRKGNWKIVREKPDNPWQLFDLAADKGESNDLASRNPQKVRELTAEFARWEDSLD
jgi:arylsulfatase A